jgi:two-component system LytT family sensor kinase
LTAALAVEPPRRNNRGLEAMSARNPKPPALRPPVAAYAGAWAVLATVYAVLYTASGAPAFMAARGAVAAVLPDALLGLVSLRLARRWPWPIEGRWRLATRLIPALLALAAASTAGWLLLIGIDGWLVTGAARWPAGSIILWQTVINGLIHLALAGIGYAWHTAEALREARERTARAEVLRARAELALLRSQLHPHFVLNLLHALLGLVRRDPAQAERAIERLGELLRFGQWVHQTGSDWVPLSREWEFVTSYLELERLRLGDRLRVDIQADPSALEVPVPPFALQPLVENAIVHAIAPRAAGGRLALSARRSGGRLVLVVEDDGPGVSEAEIAKSPRMGLRLLQERLAALYAGRARLSFDAPEGGGLRVRLELPDDGAAEVA